MKRALLGLGVLMGLLATLVTTSAAPSADAAGSYARSPQIVPGNYFNPDGVIYGYLGDYAAEGSRHQSSYAQISFHEAQIGREVSIVHVFSGGWAANFDGTFRNRLDTLQTSVDQGKIPMYSLGTPDAAHVDGLIAGNQAEIDKVRAWATEYRESGIGPMFARLAHESDRMDTGKRERPWRADPEKFIAWWRAFVTTVETDAPGYTAPTDLIWQWSPTAWGFWHGWDKAEANPVDSRAASLYPGDAYVDWVGSSGYDYPCEFRDEGKLHNKTHEAVLAGALTWASQVVPDKPFMVAEWGSENFNDDRSKLGDRASFFATTDDMLRSGAPGFNQIGAMVYFDRHHNETADGGCKWLLHDSMPGFPAPHLAYNLGANAQLSPSNADDFEAYRTLVNTPGMFVPAGAYASPQEPETPRSCSALPVGDVVRVSWKGFDGVDVNLRRDGGWIHTHDRNDPGSSFDDAGVAAGATPSYVVRARVNGTTIDTPCGTETVPTCSVSIIDGQPVLTWRDMDSNSINLRIDDTWRMTLTSAAGDYVDTAAQAGVTHRYVIRISADGGRVDIDCGQATVPAGPTCQSTVVGGVVTISWGDIGPRSGLNLLRNGAWLATVADPADDSIVDRTASPGQTAAYTLRARYQGVTTDHICGSVTLNACIARSVAGGVEVSWTEFGDATLNLRRDGGWLTTAETGSTAFTDVAGGVGNVYELVVRSNGKQTIGCGSAAGG